MMDFEEINAILAGMCDEGMVEPIDEKHCHPLDWATVVGVEDDVFGEMYPYADEDREDFHADEAVGYVSYGNDNPFGD